MSDPEVRGIPQVDEAQKLVSCAKALVEDHRKILDAFAAQDEKRGPIPVHNPIRQTP